MITRIFGLWAIIDQELGMLLVRILKAEEGPALAIYDVLTSDSLRRSALNAAAESVFKDREPELEIFSAVVNVAISAGKLRHKLAHWRWGTCAELPDAVLLADPSALNEQTKELLRIRYAPPDAVEKTKRGWEDDLALYSFDKSKILVYTRADLERHLDHLQQAMSVMYWYKAYLHPMHTDELIAELRATHEEIQIPMPDEFTRGTSAEALRRLSNLKLFQEARVRLSRDTNSSPPPQS